MTKSQGTGCVSTPTDIQDRHNVTGVVLSVGVATLVVSLAGARFANAEDFTIGEINLTVHGGATTGTVIRADNPDPQLVTIPNGKNLNIPANGNTRQSDDGEQNFKKGQPVSTTLRGWGSINANYDGYGVYVREKGWTDFTLQDTSVARGNYPNGLIPNTPLSDNGFENRAKFTGLALQGAYVYGRAGPIDFRVGEQYIPWGLNFAVAGGISALNPFDFPAAHRAGAIGSSVSISTLNTYDFPAAHLAGAVAEEVSVPVPAAFVTTAITPKLTFEGFWQFAAARNAYDGCGTFYGTDFFPVGCNYILTGAPFTATDPQSLYSGDYVTRAPTPHNTEIGQGGVALKYAVDAIRTTVGSYYAHYNNRNAIFETSRTFRQSAAVPFIAGNPDGGNPLYRTVYANDIDMFAINFRTMITDNTILSGEYVYRPDMPIALGAGEEFSGAATATGPNLYRADIDALAPGQFYQGYDRHQTGALNVSLAQVFEEALGAKQIVLVGEFALRQVYDLPDPNVRRYVRSDVFGNGPVNGVCPAPPSTAVNYTGCTFAGFVTSNAWGYRLRGAYTYEVPTLRELNLVVAGSYGRDAHGWSYDTSFNQGRNIATISLRAEYKRNYFVELSYAPTWGGAYNPQRDRSVYVASMGARF